MSGNGTLPSAIVKRRVPRPGARAVRNSIAHSAKYVVGQVARHRGRVAVAKDEDDEHRKPTILEACWPTVFGVLLAVIAGHLRQKVISDFGVVGDRLVFPWVQIFDRPDLGFGDPDALSQFMLLLQFPLTGLYATWSLLRGQKFGMIIAQIVFVYGLGAFVLWLLSTPGASHGM